MRYKIVFENKSYTRSAGVPLWPTKQQHKTPMAFFEDVDLTMSCGPMLVNKRYFKCLFQLWETRNIRLYVGGGDWLSTAGALRFWGRLDGSHLETRWNDGGPRISDGNYDLTVQCIAPRIIDEAIGIFKQNFQWLGIRENGSLVDLKPKQYHPTKNENTDTP